MTQLFRRAFLSVLSLAGAGVCLAADAPASKQQPVFVYLYTRMDDHVNWEYSEDRFHRILPILERLRAAKPELAPSCLLLVSGASTEMLAQRDAATKVLTSIKEAKSKGWVEVGYDGENEPSHLVRPQPNFRSATTPDARWMARSDPYGWFLSDYKNRLTGEPDASRPGGLKYVQQVFGPAATVFGVVTMELGGDPEAANQIRALNQTAILPGLPEGDTWPARNLDGFGGSVLGFSNGMSPGPQFAPELYFQSGFLRLSNTSRSGVKSVPASGGPEAFQAVLKALDRSRPHVIRVQFGSPSDYVKPTFNHGVINPLRWAYENPKRQRVMEADRLAPEAINGAYEKETALLDWLANEFMPGNPGSRFVTAAELNRMAQTATGTEIPIGTLREASKTFVTQWKASGTFPPDFATASGKYFSLSDLFYLLANALSESERTGKLPQSVKLGLTQGTDSTPDDLSRATGTFARADIVKTASTLVKALNDTQWKALPANRIPGYITVAGTRMYASQFLQLMAEALDAPAEAKLQLTFAWMFSPAMEGAPRNRPRWDDGGMWTSKPAPLIFSAAAQ